MLCCRIACFNLNEYLLKMKEKTPHAAHTFKKKKKTHARAHTHTKTTYSKVTLP